MKCQRKLLGDIKSNVAQFFSWLYWIIFQKFTANVLVKFNTFLNLELSQNTRVSPPTHIPNSCWPTERSRLCVGENIFHWSSFRRFKITSGENYREIRFKVVARVARKSKLWVELDEASLERPKLVEIEKSFVRVSLESLFSARKIRRTKNKKKSALHNFSSIEFVVSEGKIAVLIVQWAIRTTPYFNFASRLRWAFVVRWKFVCCGVVIRFNSVQLFHLDIVER